MSFALEIEQRVGVTMSSQSWRQKLKQKGLAKL